MNFLAHLHVAEATPESRLGNLLGDFVRGYPWDDRYSDAVWKGIVEHRYVDSFTDEHPSWQKSRDLLPASLRRYAGIVIDVFYDFFLHRHWASFSNQHVDTFIAEVHADLKGILDEAPLEAAEAISRMIDEGWLHSYASYEGIESTLNRIAMRSSILRPIPEAMKIFEENTDQMDQHFLEFYPDLLSYVPEVRSGIDEGRI